MINTFDSALSLWNISLPLSLSSFIITSLIITVVEVFLDLREQARNCTCIIFAIVVVSIYVLLQTSHSIYIDKYKYFSVLLYNFIFTVVAWNVLFSVYCIFRMLWIKSPFNSIHLRFHVKSSILLQPFNVCRLK